MISNAAGGTVVNYSDRFTLSGMTGTFPPNVQAGIKNIKGTTGPATENNVNNAANPAAGGGQGAGGLYGVPYTLQTGATKYAPMQRRPGTKITMKAASMQYPTSVAQTAKTFLPTPAQVTTMTLSGTYNLPESVENTVSYQTRIILRSYQRACVWLTNHVGFSGTNAYERYAKIPESLEGLSRD